MKFLVLVRKYTTRLTQQTGHIRTGTTSEQLGGVALPSEELEDMHVLRLACREDTTKEPLLLQEHPCTTKACVCL